MRGAIAADMKGFVFAIGSDDHPAALLNSDPIAAPLGEVKVAKLSLQLVGSFAIQGSAKRWSPGCENISGKLWQKWQATAATKFTKPGDRLVAEPCI